MIAAIVGGQYGSEGKGAIAAHIARDYGLHVRVGAANAGHTAYVAGSKHVVQQLPVGAFAAPSAICALGPGALVSPGILNEEINANRIWRENRGEPELDLVIDPRAHIVRDEHVQREIESGLDKRIGSTSTIAKEGIGVATAARVMREPTTRTAGDLREVLELDLGARVQEVPDLIYEGGHKVLLEGTQGAGLSLTTGQYPYVTSRNTTAAGLAADCGVGPRDIDRVIVVMRTYPIRVSSKVGPSGPFYPDCEETSFEKIGVPPETTTVTKLQRRIATFSYQQAVDGVRLNSATSVALTFADYIAPTVAGLTHDNEVDYTDPEVTKLRGLIFNIETLTGCPVWMLGTGPQSVIERLPERNLEGVPLRG